MDVREMKALARSIVRETQMLDSHFLRWLNMAYRQLSQDLIVPALQYGDPIDLIPVDDSTQKFYLPYDFSAIIAIFDENGRKLDPIQSMDVREFGEYNSFGSFVAFYEYTGIAVDPLAESGDTPITIDITNRDTTVTATGGTPFTSDMEGEFLLPINRNTSASASSTEDYAYRISDFTSTSVVELERPFRGVISDAGTVGDLTTGYFEVRPRNTRTVRIWGDPGSSQTFSLEYQRIPSKLANDEDIPEDNRLSMALVYKAIQLAGWSYMSGFHAKAATAAIAEAMGQFRKVAERDKQLIHNFLTANPNNRSYSQISGLRMGQMERYSGSSGNY